MGTFTGTAGENLTDGQVCYLKSDGKFWKAKADATATMPAVAMAAAAITAGASGLFYKYGEVTQVGHALGDPGTLLYVSAATAGLKTVTPPATSGNQVQVIGQIKDADTIRFNDNLVIIEVP